ncbi:hypothetical protein [Xenorhabdus innexi]|uniref:Uncharacterized protein n=1 Tax=Xenorhabdus innexi TaxID=290109 RepID=A0A1N6MQP0_9GAMM|nr:hypothetical protein [Xenorhabdus innexi]PHM35566.1 hypothetical protein Xinn_02252 [Xenorhabdus innexi]SIP71136.1 conserved hypothetical protein [Xenorhabdus innexi]
MKKDKINLCIMTLIILLCCLDRGNATESINHSVISNNVNNNSKENIGVYSSDYNLTFKNSSKRDDLKINVKDDKCMKNHGYQSIYLKSGESSSEKVTDYNTLFSCFREDKFVKWNATTYKGSKPYQSCDFELLIYVPSFPIGPYLQWHSAVNTSHCNLEISANCNGLNCLNNGVFVEDGYRISIDIKDDRDIWIPPKITSSDPQAQAKNNYITIIGQGVMEDDSLPYIVTDFDKNKYKVEPIEGTKEQWRTKIWINCGVAPGQISIEGIENSGITIKGPPCGATITSMKDGQIIPDGKYGLSGLINVKTPQDDKNVKVSISVFDDPEYTHISEPPKEYTPDVDINSGVWIIKNLTAKCFHYYKASVLFNPNKKGTEFLSGKKDVKFAVSRCPVSITKPIMREFITPTNGNAPTISVEGKVTEKTPLDVHAIYYPNGEHIISTLSQNGNDWATTISDAPDGFIKIKAKNKGTADIPVKDSNDEVTILKSKDFSVKYEVIDKVYLQIYGTSLPTEDKQTSEFKDTLHPKVIILVDGVKQEEITPDAQGNWRSDNKYYARRGVYIFTIHETSDNKYYQARKDKVLECTGEGEHMTCIEKNN